MSFLRNVLHDLVEKRLWPIALLLVVALIAIPVALGGSSQESSSTPANDLAVAPAAKAAGTAQVVSDDTVVQGPVTRSGKTRNPFKQQHLAAATDTPQETAAPTQNASSGQSGSSTSSDSGSSDQSSTTPSDTTTPAAKPKAKTDPQDLYRVDLRFGEVGDLRTRNNVARLTPLPSSTNPFLIFLGVKSDGKTAVFLVSAEAVPSGDGKCRPSAKSCESLELKAGDTELVDLQTGTAGVVQYRLDLRKIEKVTASSAALAAKARARESKAGREYLRLTLASDPSALDAWGYSAKLGVLVQRTPDLREGDVAHLPTSIAQNAAG